jgi:hypothetical protein
LAAYLDYAIFGGIWQLIQIGAGALTVHTCPRC